MSHLNQRKVWCKCLLPLHRGARHYITKKQRDHHRTLCYEQRIPFTPHETIAEHEGLDLHNHNLDLHDDNVDLYEDNVDLHNHNLELITQEEDVTADEDDQPEISDWIQDTAATVDHASSDAYAEHVDMFDAFKGIPREQIKRIRRAMKTHYDIDIGNPIQTGHRIFNDMVGDVLQPKYYDCCRDGCVAFTGRLLAANTCPTCNKARYKADGRAIYTFQYVPLVPRLVIQYSNSERSTQLSSYRAKFDPSQPDNGDRDDVFDGSWFRECWSDGYFQDDRDLAMRLTLDAVSTVKNPKKRQSITPVVVYLLNLSPEIRDDASNALITHIIPGGFDKSYADTWLLPLVAELHQLREGVDAYDGAGRQDFTLKAHLILVTGDGLAIADVMGTKHPGKAKQSCRMCTFSGTKGRGGKYFYPHAGNTAAPINANLRDQIEEIEQARANGTTRRDFEQLKTDRGINCRSILVDIPTLHFPRSFPIDTMHSMNHNIPKSLFYLWKGSKYQQRGRGVENHAWVIPKPDWMLIDLSLEASRATVPTYVGTAPRNTGSFANWTTHEWRSFFLTYGAPPIDFYLRKAYADNFMQYRELLRYTSQHQFTRNDVAEVDARVHTFIAEYERLYYKGEEHLLPSCTIQFHYLLHLRKNIEDFGPPSCYAQWSLERFLRTIKSFSTSTLYKHRSTELNALIREQRRHAMWTNVNTARATACQSTPDAASTNTGFFQLVRETHKSMEGKWQRELQRVHDPRASWYTGTEPQDMKMYCNLILPTGAKVGLYNDRLQALAARCNAFVMFYMNGDRRQRPLVHGMTAPLSFGTVVALFMDPADWSQWAGIVRCRKVQPASCTLPRPRMMDEEANDIIWVSVEQVCDVVGVAQVCYWDERQARLCRRLYFVDKHGYSER